MNDTIKVNIIKDQQERFNIKRGWFVNAWRIVFDGTDRDAIQPWANTKKEALETCEVMGYTIVKPKIKLGN